MNDMQDIFINLSQTYPQIQQLISAVCYLLGLAFSLKGVWALKVYGEMRTMMTMQHHLRIPVTLLVIGSVLLFIPAALPTFMQTLYGYGDKMPLAYGDVSANSSVISMRAILGFVQIVGFIAFIRGWVQLAHNAHQQGGHGAGAGKAWTHIIGGLLAVNILGTKDILASTFGFN